MVGVGTGEGVSVAIGGGAGVSEVTGGMVRVAVAGRTVTVPGPGWQATSTVQTIVIKKMI
jgi:hypothetical protein